MKLIILAAGYATRLYPLTLNQPKPLLRVSGKPIIEHLIDNLAEIDCLDHVYVVTNAKFIDHFERWAQAYRVPGSGPGLTIVNDLCTDDSNKLGAVGDLHLALEQHQIKDDIMVVAGDNLFSEKLAAFGNFCLTMSTPVLAVYDVGNLDEIKKYNAIEVDPAGRITFFEEKPKHPKSTLTGIALYYYPQVSVPLIQRYIEEGNNPDQPGLLVQWMYGLVPFHTWKVPGIWYDIGSQESLADANRVFARAHTGNSQPVKGSD